ncbi:diaminopimelate decarboxylase [Clostridium culturomicium]|uniref:diaminopimelate decarboxylase n=1 Tax=Clostridium culturomicium TaxID=1499683 RepID=UPI00058C0126|nr:diaminopimelate decarboxylase [Clostridium culturomicium]
MIGNQVVDGQLYFDGCKLEELAKKYGTPLYVVSEDIIRDKCAEVKTSFLNKYPNTMAFYASKAFLTISMCKIIKEEGLGMDVVSGGELYVAIKGGINPDNIMFHGNNKTIEELKMAVTYNVGRIVVDSVDELLVLKEITEEMKKEINILFRITPNIKCNTHTYISTGQKDSKFGIPLIEEIIKEAINIAMNSKYINFKGIHFHVGSQLFDNSSHINAVKNTADLIKNIKESMDIEIEELNVGGGFGIKYIEEDEPKPLSYFIDAIMKTIYEKFNEYNLKIPRVFIEPGRWMVGEAGVTLYTIGTIKEIPEVRTYVSVDGGLPDNPRTALYTAKYSAYVPSKMNEERDKVVTIAGKCCESGDIIIWDLKVPYSIERGDILAVMSTGAYNYSMASNYNKIAKPAVVMLRNGKDRVVVRRETYKDLIALDVV